MQAALYRLPSMHFLESLLDEMDSRSASVGNPPAEPPLYLPLDSFDLPGLDSPGAQVNDLAQLGLPPLPRRVHSAHAGIGNALGHDHQQAAAAMRMRPPVPPFDMPQHNYISMIPNAGSAAPSPQRGMPMPNRSSGPAALARQTANALEELYGFEEAEVSLQTSKSGRVRKVTSFTGAKRKMGDMISQVSAPAALAGERYSMQHTQDSDLTTGSDAGEEVDREFMKFTGGKFLYLFILLLYLYIQRDHHFTLPKKNLYRLCNRQEGQAYCVLKLRLSPDSSMEMRSPRPSHSLQRVWCQI